MTDLAPPRPRKTDRRHRSPEGPGLFITDGELIEMLGVPPDVARPTIAELDRRQRDTGFPQKDPLFGGRRYRPAVEEWLAKRYGLKMGASTTRRAS